MLTIEYRTSTIISFLEAAKKLKACKPNQTVLEHVLFTANGEMIVTNLSTWLIYQVLKMKKGEAPIFCLPRKELLALLKPWKALTTTFAITEEGNVKVNGVLLNGLNPMEFPEVPPVRGSAAFLAPDDLEKVMKVSAACSTDTNKQTLNGVWLGYSQRMKSPICVALDGHRLMIEKIAWAGPEILVHRDVIALLVRLFSGRKSISGFDGMVKVNSERFCIRQEHLTVIAEHFQGRFPDYERVIGIPNECSTHISIPENLIDQLLPGKALTTDKYAGVKIEANGSVEAKIASPGVGEWTTELQGAVKSGKDATFAVNLSYLEEALKSLGEGGTMHVHTEDEAPVSGPIIFTDSKDEIKGVVMPLMP